jgi:hypothetical protein
MGNLDVVANVHRVILSAHLAVLIKVMDLLGGMAWKRGRVTVVHGSGPDCLV